MTSFFEKLKSSVGVEGGVQAPAPSKIKVRANVKEEPREEEKKESSWFQPEGELAVDVYETDNDIIIQSTIAGILPDSLDISTEEDTITIRGERKNPNEQEQKNYFTQECYWGPFSRQIILPKEVDFTRADATMKEGIFTLRLPKLDRQKVRRIKVRG